MSRFLLGDEGLLYMFLGVTKSTMITENRVCFFVLSILMSLSVCSCASNIGSKNSELYVKYTDYRDIPGITQNEIDAIEAIKTQRSTLLYGMCLSTEAFLNENGTIEGYSALFCEWLTELFDIRFEPVLLEWDKLYSQLDDGTISFTGELTLNPERQKTYYMTSAIAQRQIKAFRTESSERLIDIANVRKPKFAFLTGTNTDTMVKTVAEYDFEMSFVSNYNEAITKLQNGEIDAFITDGPAEAGFSDYPDIAAEEFFPLLYTLVSLSTPDPTLDPFITVVQKYLSSGAIEQLAQLYNEGYQDYLRYKLFLSLTDIEKEYISNHVQNNIPIPNVNDFDIYPVAFYNTREKEWQGIAIDVIKEISELTGLQFETINSTSDDWHVLFEMLESGQAAMTTELMYTKERENRFLWAEEPYLTDRYALLSTEEHKDININTILHSNVGLIYESAYADVFNTWFPDHPHTTLYPNMDDAFAGLEKGEIDVIMTAKNMLLRATNYMEQSGFKVNLVFDKTSASFFGFNNEQTVLCSIISKAQKLVETEQITSRWTSKVYDYRVKLVQSRIPLLISLLTVICLAFILALMLFFLSRRSNTTLENTVRERTAQLQHQTEVALSSAKAKSAFLANMSHEIRTPLNAIVGMAEIAKQKTSDDTVISSIDEVLGASRHLQALINDVLDFSKIESGKMDLLNEEFDLYSTIQEIESLMNPRCVDKDLVFDMPVITVPGIYLLGDKLRLKQVLINLLGNAVKFTNNGGSIIFAADIVSQDSDKITLTFSVCDNGIGISKEQIPNLFTAFEQGDTSIAVQYGGTGLGLAISQRLVQAMGGEISVDSVQGEGTTFSFTVEFKKATTHHATVVDNSHTSNIDFSDKRILMAEDIKINRIIFKELLSDTGVKIEMAEDGKQAVKMYEDSPLDYYDLIIMDIQMPKMNGYQATILIRSMDRPDAETIPIVAMTANAYREDVEKALAVGMNGHLSKPIDIEAVKKLLFSFFS